MSRLFALWALVTVVCCMPEQSQKEVYSVLYDTTDPLRAVPDADNLWRFMDGDNTRKHLLVRYATLSDVDMNVMRSLERPAAASNLLSNAVQEKKRLAVFKEDFYALIGKKDSVGASHSAIFKPILSEIQHLTSLSASRKHLIVYSNLMENSDWMSFYKGSDLWLLENKPEEILERYHIHIPEDADYLGVNLHIVFIPKDFEENTRFNRLKHLYLQVFEGTGVSISFSGNLTKAQDMP